MTAPIRHPAPAGELRLEWPGKCWVWACSDRAWPRAFQALYWAADGEDVTFANGYPDAWYAVRTRGPLPPWPEYINQRDPGDETEADGFITYTGPSEGFTAEGARG
jgi:hypothetical protein